MSLIRNEEWGMIAFLQNAKTRFLFALTLNLLPWYKDEQNPSVHLAEIQRKRRAISDIRASKIPAYITRNSF